MLAWESEGLLGMRTVHATAVEELELQVVMDGVL